MTRAAPMLLPDAALVALRSQWRLHRGAWLLDAAAPVPIALRVPTQAQASAGFAAFGQWLQAWRDTALPGRVEWGEVKWSHLGLQRLRRYAPQTVALLMDETTLRDTPSSLWGHERRQHRAQRLDALSAAEQTLYSNLRSGRFGPAQRLEQERIAWDYAWPRIRAALGESHASPCAGLA